MVVAHRLSIASAMLTSFGQVPVLIVCSRLAFDHGCRFKHLFYLSLESLPCLGPSSSWGDLSALMFGETCFAAEHEGFQEMDLLANGSSGRRCDIVCDSEV